VGWLFLLFPDARLPLTGVVVSDGKQELLFVHCCTQQGLSDLSGKI
jgi:hypothetical protein